MRHNSVAVVGLLLLAVLAQSTDGTLLLPFWDSGSSLSERFPDPFRILEHIPFGIDRDDDQLALPTQAKVDWKETANTHEIMIDVPGLKKDELKIEIEENRVLRVSGERKKEEEQKGDHWHRIERSYGKFWRRFRLPDNADLDNISAKMENGVLKLTIAKLAPEQIKGPRVVTIAGGEEKAKLEDTSDSSRKVEL